MLACVRRVSVRQSSAVVAASFQYYGRRTAVRAASAAATSRQKRSLNKDQIEGTGGSEIRPPPPTSTIPKPPAAGGGGGGGGGDNSMLLMGIGAAVVVGGGAAYYFSSSNGTTDDNKAIETTPAAKEEAMEAPKDEMKKVATTVAESSAPVAAPADGPNRVVSVHIPPKMKNVAQPGDMSHPSAPVLAHPAGGNRVKTIVAAGAAGASTPEESQLSSSAVSSMTEKAVEELQASTTRMANEAVVQSHQSLWSSMDAEFFADLDRLNTSQLKARIVQLATEMKDRTKWEAVRLKEFLAMKEKETADKYMDILQKQRHEFEDLLAKRLREQENALVQQTNAVLQEKEASIQNLLNTALEAQKEEHEQDKAAFQQTKAAELMAQFEEQYGSKIEEYKRQVAAELQQKVKTLEALTAKLQHLEHALETSQTSQQGSLKAHRLSAAALALSEKLETSKPAATELQALKAAAGEGGVIATALATIPPTVNTGVPTMSELQARFDQVHKRCRQAAMVPAGRVGLDGQLAGMLFATLKYAPDPDDPAPENDKNHPEFVLVRARKHVQLGDLEAAVEQLEKLPANSQVAFTAKDWLKDALDRIKVEKALKVIKMECALVNESFAS